MQGNNSQTTSLLLQESGRMPEPPSDWLLASQEIIIEGTLRYSQTPQHDSRGEQRCLRSSSIWSTLPEAREDAAKSSPTHYWAKVRHLTVHLLLFWHLSVLKQPDFPLTWSQCLASKTYLTPMWVGFRIVQTVLQLENSHSYFASSGQNCLKRTACRSLWF